MQAHLGVDEERHWGTITPRHCIAPGTVASSETRAPAIDAAPPARARPVVMRNKKAGLGRLRDMLFVSRD